jgi:flagellar biosynthesis protein FlhG
MSVSEMHGHRARLAAPPSASGAGTPATSAAAAGHGSSGASPSSPGMVTIAISSGKGGVGKTNVVVNLAVSLARLRHRVVVLDADFGLGNVDVLLGLAPESHLGHVLSGEKTVHEILVPGPEGIRIIPASSGLRELTVLSSTHWNRLSAGLASLTHDCDFLLIDTAAGIADNVLEMLAGSERVLIVTSPEPTAVVDAYALIKVLTTVDAHKDIGLLVNDARDAEEAGVVFRQLEVAATRFLHRRVHYYGFVAHDPAVRDSVCVQQPVVFHHPQSPASLCFRMLASRVAGLRPLGAPGLKPVPRPVTLPEPGADLEAPQCA